MSTSGAFRRATSLDSETTRADAGSIESGLILIPVTALFLLVAQVIVAGSWQSLETARLHDIVNRVVIAHPGASSDELRSSIRHSLGSVTVNIQELPQGKILTVIREVPIPIISNLISERAAIRAIAVVHAD